jgi:hypothetical protein
VLARSLQWSGTKKCIELPWHRRPAPVRHGVAARKCGRKEVKTMRHFAMAMIALAFVAGTAIGQDGTLYLEYQGDPTLWQLPPQNAEWHELYPNFCTMHVQESYSDNGDGAIGPCDVFTLDRTFYHIDWVGPTYYLEADCPGMIAWAEPTAPQTGGDPTCEVWRWVEPNFGLETHIDGWADEGDGLLGLSDWVQIDDTWWRIQEIGLNITASPSSPTENSTWGKIKGFFKDMIK